MTTSTKRHIGIYGSGRTATELVRALHQTEHVVTAAVVHARHRAGTDLGLLTTGEPLGLPATADLRAAMESGSFEVLLYAGLSGETHEEAMALCAEAGIDMVHACFVHPGVALAADVHRQLAESAARSGARIVGTGMIPGLWLDVLPSLLVSGLPAPVSVRARRTSDITAWGTDVLVQELGVGTQRAGRSEHVDRMLRESARMIADVLRLDGPEPESRGGLVIADHDTQVAQVQVRRGEVEGFRQEVVVVHDGEERVTLTWSGLAGPSDGGADGDKAVQLSLTGGDGTTIDVLVSTPLDPYPGTAARMVAAIGGLAGLTPGLHPTTALPIS